ncbi:MAG TPA: phosphatidylglycerophosphatase A, partial [Candidatus Polarisedimenticolia bacterium]|nr:phosphatidylglycerophosphatase A [Candidatus Polarisedimenticolia bacterium]
MPPTTSSRWSPAWLAATFFGVGLIPFASGTFATLATIPLYLGLHFGLGPAAVCVAAVVVSIGGIVAAGAAEKTLGYHDPSE